MNGLPGALLLDLDGTLADTAPDLTAALDLVMSQCGLEPLPYELARSRVSDGARGLIALGFPDADEEEREARKAELLDAYAMGVADATRLFPDMDEILLGLEAEDRPWGVVTNKPERFTTPVMMALGLDARSGCTISGDTTEFAKPHPEPLLLAASELGVDPEDCLYVGDARRDVEAARAAGMPVAAALWGYIHEDDDPASWGADELLEEPAALAILLGL